MRRLRLPLLLLLLAAGAYYTGAAPTVETSEAPSPRRPAGASLPPEALHTLRLVERGGPFPYRQDGAVFQNREKRLPSAPRGYYREYTVPTPGSPDRGARRIVTGGDPPERWYYTDDHYRTFRTLTAADRESP